MADAAVEFLLEKLRNLVLDEKPKLYMKTEMEQLERELRIMKVFLNDSTAKQRRNDPVVREIVRQATDVIYEADDVIDSILTYKANHSRFRMSLRSRLMDNKFSGQLSGVTAKITSFFSFSRKVQSDFASLGVDEEQDKENLKEPAIRRDNIVGFGEEMKTLVEYLCEETEQLDVSTIVGMPGIGKTTLAWKIYTCPEIEYEFPIRIWIHVSNNFTDKDIFLAILRKFRPDDVIGQSVEELAELVFGHLKHGRFLIVLDDVRSVDDWDRLQIALPKFNNLIKVLITTCNEAMGRHASRSSRLPCKVRFLNDSESWSLLQLEVFGKHDGCPQELENVGKLIAKQCKGLPLAVVVMGGILAQKDNPSSAMAERKAVWIKACQEIPVYLNEKFYDDLPQHLRVCFLYFGMFPSKFEISVWNLVRMWIAEGFILKREDGFSVEETAENYLEDLINRHLVEVGQYSGDGKVKTCSIHQMLHDFCKIKARTENVLQEIKCTHGVFEPPISQLSLNRRLCIHSDVPDFLHSKPSCPRVRSFVSFSSDEINLPPKDNSAIPAAFQQLRLLDIKPIIFSKFPSELFQLLHLRYLALSLSLSFLPVGFSKLWSLQTLIVDTTCRTLEIKADILKLADLRHFKTNASADLLRSSKTRQEAQKLQTLAMVSPQCCTEENFGTARNLKKLGIRGRLSPFFDGTEGSFDCVGKLANLVKLKLLNDVFPRAPSQSRVQSLPPAYKFPPRLRSLTLSDTLLDWTKMSVLASLEKLQVLKLKGKAFMGHTWVTDDGGFRDLQALHIGHTDLVIWVASAYHFPELRNLELYNCEKLQEVPIELADIPSFQRLELYQTKLAAASANRIHERKQKYIQERSHKQREFKLSVFPQN
ncbi:putative disease resistance RPP8-like protein 4 [Salvia divinorum]|uniref:Disease resistance RPP8-like protein 4 n=1 Tax=Salvia divinorum TaxID=28513 RepID=A0ABD1ILA7_SALDI